MPYVKKSRTKIPRILQYLRQDMTSYTTEEIKNLLQDKFRVGVHIQYGRLNGQVHTFEIYRRMRDSWLEIICFVEIPVERFKPE